MKGDKYKSRLIKIIEETSIAIEKNDSLKVRSNLDYLRQEFCLMDHCAFAGGRSTFAILYVSYKALEDAYREKISERDENLLGLS